MFEITLIKVPESILDIQRILGKLMSGDMEDDYIEVFQTSEVTFKAQKEIPWTLDGEYGGSPKEVNIRLRPEAIPIFAPK